MKVFVYGTLMAGGRFHHALKSAKFLGEDTIPADNFTMRDLGSYPALVVSDDAPPILGEVYLINENIQRGLDRIEGYPSFYDRMLVKTVGKHKVWVYYLKGELNQLYPLILSGSWRKHLETVRDADYAS